MRTCPHFSRRISQLNLPDVTLRPASSTWQEQGIVTTCSGEPRMISCCEQTKQSCIVLLILMITFNSGNIINSALIKTYLQSKQLLFIANTCIKSHNYLYWITSLDLDYNIRSLSLVKKDLPVNITYHILYHLIILSSLLLLHH
jgi:hypothetical protein